MKEKGIMDLILSIPSALRESKESGDFVLKVRPKLIGWVAFAFFIVSWTAILIVPSESVIGTVNSVLIAPFIVLFIIFGFFPKDPLIHGTEEEKEELQPRTDGKYAWMFTAEDTPKIEFFIKDSEGNPFLERFHPSKVETYMDVYMGEEPYAYYERNDATISTFLFSSICRLKYTKKVTLHLPAHHPAP